MNNPAITFLSLFVGNLENAAAEYTYLFGAPSDDHTGIPAPHPYGGSKPPAVFHLGTVKLVLYQADGKTTHPGDVGIGLTLPATECDDFLARVPGARGRIFFGPHPLKDGLTQLAIFVEPTRHFFEVLGHAEAE